MEPVSPDTAESTPDTRTAGAPSAGAARDGTGPSTGDGLFTPPEPENEPVLDYAPGSSERKRQKRRLTELADREIEIPVIVGGEEIRTGDTSEVVMPHDTDHVLARYHRAGAEEAERAVEAALEAKREWASWSFEDRAAVFLRAAELLSEEWRPTVNGATMLGQSKTVHQAEIDSACELIDFWRFNVKYAAEIYGRQPFSGDGVWNRMDHRPLEGFIYAITPFNFTSINGNLPTAPTLMGNVSIWKPASSSIYSSYFIMRLLEEAGMPGGVVNFVPGPPQKVSEPLMTSPHLAGIHFTGSTGTFKHLWRQVSENLDTYHAYPRVVGETGGKDFIVAHESADPAALSTAIVRGAFEYQGQKCSAVARCYVPDGIWEETRETMLEMIDEIRMGDPRDFRNFMTAVIDEDAYEKITGYIDHAAESPEAEIVAGGSYSDEEGWFIEPTVVVTEDPKHRLMREEIFGPVVTIYTYPDEDWEEALQLCDETSPYGLTGAIFARDRAAIRTGTAVLRQAAGNFYVNDKPTGAVVGQQPFGGARASGTNDKAGSQLNLLRWVSPRAMKENLDPPTSFEYPFMNEK